MYNFLIIQYANVSHAIILFFFFTERVSKYYNEAKSQTTFPFQLRKLWTKYRYIFLAYIYMYTEFTSKFFYILSALQWKDIKKIFFETFFLFIIKYFWIIDPRFSVVFLFFLFNYCKMLVWNYLALLFIYIRRKY